MLFLYIVGAVIALVIINNLARKSRAACPGCGAVLDFKSGTVFRCRACRAYLYAPTKAQPQIVTDDFIATGSAFLVPFADLKEPDFWEFPWPGCCPTCGRLATRTETLHFSHVGLTPRAPGVLHNWTFEIPRCDDHANGIRGEIIPDTAKHGLGFRSYKYWREFVALNAKDHVTRGSGAAS